MIQTLSAWEAQILLFIQNHLRCGFLDVFFKYFTTSANHGELWIVLLAIFMIPKKTRKGAFYGLAALALCFLCNDLILKHIFNRVRPFNDFPEIIPVIKHPTDFSFPSGHSCTAIAVGLTMFRKEKKAVGIPFLCLGILMCWSRLYCGVHYPSDVLGGAVWGVAASFIVCGVGSLIEKKIAAKKAAKEAAPEEKTE